ncbi:hypothetical protein ACOMHN_008197 [Nucella lapillus]
MLQMSSAGNHQYQCQNLVTCRDCLQSGHRRGNPACGTFPDPPPCEADSVSGDLEGWSVECQVNNHPSFNMETPRLMWCQRLSFAFFSKVFDIRERREACRF